jgi:protocatechuate 3,4-dioxygenase beta subunit
MTGGDKMRDVDASNITETVLKTFDKSADARFKQVISTVIRHLHDCARELELTPEEWLEAIRFLTEVGQKSTSQRQEFILLSDTLGVSALVNLLNRHPADATVPSLLGPFFRENAPELPPGANIAPHDKGEVVTITGRVADASGKPVPNALIDVWQAGSDGLYDIQTANPEQMDMRARIRADKDGRYHFRTVLPIGYGVPMDGPVGKMLTAGGRHGRRPAHIHFMLSAPGYQEIVTALYIAGDPYLETDAVFGVSSALVVAPQPVKDSATLRSVTYDFVMVHGQRDGSGRVGSDPAAILAN